MRSNLKDISSGKIGENKGRKLLCCLKAPLSNFTSIISPEGVLCFFLYWCHIFFLSLLYFNYISEILVRIIYYFSTVVPSNICMFLSCRPFVVDTFSTGLVGVKVTSVSWTKGLQERTYKRWMGQQWKNR